MRNYYVRLETDVIGGHDSFAVAREKIMEDLNGVEVRGYELKVADVQQLPKVPAPRMMEMEPAPRGGDPEQEQSWYTEADYPDDAPPHPWDQGAWIFPDDHPLAGYERAAKMNQDREPRAKQSFLEAGQKMLPRGDE
jgi:hypothetical protein